MYKVHATIGRCVVINDTTLLQQVGKVEYLYICLLAPTNLWASKH